jgi:MoxR-like ATPase
MTDLESVQKFRQTFDRLKAEIAKVIVGQDDSVEQLLVAVMCGQHCLLEGVPGLAKTLLVNTLSRLLSLKFHRIQFTPDLMPSDVVGTEYLRREKDGQARFYYKEGPIFAQVVLADEINRTPPKTQAALLEAMEERHVTVGGHTRKLPVPFHVFATENPIEQEGTYSLPIAAMDRFMFKVLVGYPRAAEEIRIARETTSQEPVDLAPVVSVEELLDCQKLVRRVPVPVPVRDYALKLVRVTRKEEGIERIRFLRDSVRSGSSPRGIQFLMLGAKARAILRGRSFAVTDDVTALLKPILRHRILLNYHATSEGLDPDRVLDKLVEVIPPRRDRFAEILPALSS